MRPPLRLLCLTLPVAAALAGCGNPDAARSIEVGATRTQGSGGSVVAAAGSGGSAEAAKTAAQIFSDTGDAFRSLTSYHLLEMPADPGKNWRFEATVASRTMVEVTMTDDTGARVSLITAGPSSFLMANLAWWQAIAGSSASSRVISLLAGQWFYLPATYSGRAAFDSITSGAGDPGHAFTCLFGGHGTLTRGAATTWNGHRVIPLTDAGDIPGSVPGTLDVALDGAPYPLRWVFTRPSSPVRPSSDCALPQAGQVGDMAHSESIRGGGVVEIDGFDEALTVRPPYGAPMLPGI